MFHGNIFESEMVVFFGKANLKAERVVSQSSDSDAISIHL